MNDVALKVVDPLPAPTYSVISYSSSELPKNYEGYLFSHWLNNQRYKNPTFKSMPEHLNKEFYAQYHIFIEKLLAKPDSLTKLAVASDDHDIVYGFSVSREDVLDYIYVGRDFRRSGIGTSLMPPKVSIFTNITTIAIDIWQNNPKYKHLVFNNKI